MVLLRELFLLLGLCMLIFFPLISVGKSIFSKDNSQDFAAAFFPTARMVIREITEASYIMKASSRGLFNLILVCRRQEYTPPPSYHHDTF